MRLLNGCPGDSNGLTINVSVNSRRTVSAGIMFYVPLQRQKTGETASSGRGSAQKHFLNFFFFFNDDICTETEQNNT